MKKEAENLVREVLRAYNTRKEPNDLRECYAAARRHLEKLTNDPGYKAAELVIPPGTYEIKSAIIIPVAK